MPKLEEGNFWIRSTFPVSISLDDSIKYCNRMRGILATYPEVCFPSSRRSAAPMTALMSPGLSNVEFFCPLKPFDEWPRGLTKEKLTVVVRKKLEDTFPGVTFNFSQYISDNVEEAVSGVKGENSVKVTGPDLKVNETKATQIMDELAKVRGITDIGTFRTLRATPDSNHSRSNHYFSLRLQHGRYRRDSAGLDRGYARDAGLRGREVFLADHASTGTVSEQH